jgi:uncharacterized YccA/Bax inhibitor family protein
MALISYNPIIPAIERNSLILVVTAFKPQYSPYLAPGYALFEGLFIGGISAIFKRST